MQGEVPTAAPCGARVKGGPLEGLAQGGEAIRRASRDDLSGRWVGPRVDPGCRTGGAGGGEGGWPPAPEGRGEGGGTRTWRGSLPLVGQVGPDARRGPLQRHDLTALSGSCIRGATLQVRAPLWA